MAQYMLVSGNKFNVVFFLSFWDFILIERISEYTNFINWCILGVRWVASGKDEW